MKKKGIENPKIFPISSIFSKLLRGGIYKMSAEEQQMSEEYDSFESLKKKFIIRGLNTINYTPLSENIKNRLNNENDEIKKMENLSGITAVEFYIHRHINRYYMVNKISYISKKLLSDINAELEILKIKLSNDLSYVEKLKEISKNRKITLTEIVKFLEIYEMKDVLTDVKISYTKNLYDPFRKKLRETYDSNQKKIEEKKIKQIYEEIKELLELKKDIFESDLKTIMNKVQSDLEEKVIEKLKSQINIVGYENIFKSLYINLEVNLEISLNDEKEIMEKSREHFNFFSLKTWGSLFTNYIKISEFTENVDKKIIPLIEKHEEKTKNEFKKGIDSFKVICKNNLELAFEKFREILEDLESKNKNLDQLMGIEDKLKETLKKVEALLSEEGGIR